MDEIEQDLRGLRPGFIVSQVVGVSMVILMSIWTGHFMGGFTGQSNPGLEFNWHPLLLTISLVYLYGNGILIYRLGRNERKSRLKVAHATGGLQHDQRCVQCMNHCAHKFVLVELVPCPGGLIRCPDLADSLS